MIFLPDVNIWIALTSNRHVHHSLATECLQGIENEQIAFCRISELSFLRLLTNAHVMGKDVLSPVEAWLVYDEWRTDDRVIFLPERAEFGEEWRQLGGKIAGGPNVRTDAYLAVFASHTNATVITLDRKFPPLGKGAIKSLIWRRRLFFPQKRHCRVCHRVIHRISRHRISHPDTARTASWSSIQVRLAIHQRP